MKSITGPAALLCAALLALFASVAPMAAAPALPQADPNLLMKEEFEGAFANDPNCTDGTCNVPEGWRVWFIPHRENDPQGINYPPQYGQISTASRVRSGAAAQRIFTENKTFTAGVYRVVENVKPGSRLRFTIWGQVWSTNDNSPISARPSTDIRVKVGIDPMADADAQPSPFNGRVIWSAEQDAKDNYVQFTVEADAKSSKVTVWTYTTMKDVVRHNEVFWDDATLEVIAPPPGAETQAPTATPAAPQAMEPVTSSAPAAAPVQASPGVSYTVKEGDTLFGIALQYNKDVEEIKRLNNLDSDLLSIGQMLIIEPPVAGAPAPAAPAPTAAPAAAPDQSGQPTPPAADATTVPNGGALCVQAFFDNNGNGVRDSGENLVPNVQFTVSASGAVVGAYTTDGINEPHCLGNLAAGAYTAGAALIPDYVATSPLNDTINVSAGSNSQFSVGLRRASDGNRVIETAGTPTPVASQSSGPGIASILLTAAGALLILGALGLAVLFFLRGRRL